MCSPYSLFPVLCSLFPTPCPLVLHETLHLIQPIRHAVTRQAFQESLPIMFAHHAVIEDGEDSAVCLAADQPAKPLLQGEDGLRYLILHESITPLFIDLPDSCGDD